MDPQDISIRDLAKQRETPSGMSKSVCLMVEESWGPDRSGRIELSPVLLRLLHDIA